MLVRLLSATYLFFNLCSSLDASSKNNTKQCIVVKTISLDACDQKLNIAVIRKIITRIGDPTGMCPNICRRNFSITYVRRQLYMHRILSHISDMFDSCCNNCTSYHVHKVLNEITDINTDILASSDILYPLLGFRSLTEMYGAYYIPVFNVPSAYYITLKPTASEKMFLLFLGCISTWPLIAICILLSIISGFVIWIMERRKNSIEFPKRFHSGLYEGFWWSFISMTTVGYGDRSPKTIPGRLYAVSWVLIGITIFSILTGELTNQISDIQSEPSQDLLGKKVGGLMDKLHDATMTTQHNGFFKGKITYEYLSF